jgi:hypothetical protein
LFEKIRRRKAEFKELWGVSPMSINQARTRRRPLLPAGTTVLSDISNIPAKVLTSCDDEEGEKVLPAGTFVGLTSSCYDGEEEENVVPAGGQDDGSRRVRFNSGSNVEKLLTPNSSLQVI